MEIVSVIKYEGNNDVFVWKHPKEDFNTASQLIVHESQEALLFRNGQALDLFGAGRHTLKSGNIPLLNKLVNLPLGGVSPYHCEVYFINKVDSMDIKWGTSNPVPIQDPLYNIIVPVGANGQFGVRIEDPRKFLVKLVGTIDKFDQMTLTTYFRGLLLTRIKDYISNFIISNKISFVEIHAHLNAISSAIETELADTFEQYGIRLVNFFVNAIIIPETDAGYVRIKEALAKKAEMGIVGYDYRQERTYDILKKAAQNEGSAGSVMGAGLGLGMGVSVGQVVHESMGGLMKNAMTTSNQTGFNGGTCSSCGNYLPQTAKFCFQCGVSVNQVSSSQIICTECNQPTPKGIFCMHCGQKIIAACPKCKTELPDMANFCLNCGQKV